MFIPEVTETNKNKIRKFTITKDIPVGQYSEKDFKALVGDKFISSGTLKHYCDIGWIKVLDIKDVTKKTVKNILDSNKL